MKCINCKYNDGMVYTSMPPKYKCTITKEFHLGDDDCNVEFAPVKHGHWIEAPQEMQNEENLKNDNKLYICSFCDAGDVHSITQIVPYCWNILVRSCYIYYFNNSNSRFDSCNHS